MDPETRSSEDPVRIPAAAASVVSAETLAAVTLAASGLEEGRLSTKEEAANLVNPVPGLVPRWGPSTVRAQSLLKASLAQLIVGAKPRRLDC